MKHLKTPQELNEASENLNISGVSESNWRDVESNIEPWGKDMELMDKLLDEFEKQYYSLDEHSWEEIQDIKKALWIGYNYSH
jgi:hypothetical protein